VAWQEVVEAEHAELEEREVGAHAQVHQRDERRTAAHEASRATMNDVKQQRHGRVEYASRVHRQGYTSGMNTNTCTQSKQADNERR